MRRIIYLLVFILSASFSFALTSVNVENTHTFDVANIRVSNPFSKVLVLNTENNQTSSFDVKVYQVFPKVKAIELDNNDNFTSNIKIYARTSVLSVESRNNSINSNKFQVNVSARNITLLSNTSKLYADFIKGLNVTVIVGKNSFDEYILDKYGVGYNGFVIYNSKTLKYPFNAVIISVNGSVFIYGNAVEGEVSALRYLKKHIDEFKYVDNTHVIDDIDALSVYDYMHLVENQKWYNTDGDEFKEIVNRSLYGIINESIIDVKSNDGVLLRVIEVSSLNSKKLKNYRNTDPTPIVFAGGLWSNIYYWKELGIDFASLGKKTYLIEITGGPGQDCVSCVNYNYDNLVDNYWPSIIATIQTLNNNSEIIYIGHSNGARTGVSSLEKYNSVGIMNAGSYYNGSAWINVSMTPNPVKTYIAVAMPGSFDGEQNALGNVIKDNHNEIVQGLEYDNSTHPTIGKVISIYGGFPNIFGETERISLNLVKDYFKWVYSNEDVQPKITNISKTIIITGIKYEAGDGIVTKTDQNNLFNDSDANITHQYYIFTWHMGMSGNKQIQNIIKDEVSDMNTTIIKKMWSNAYREK